MRSMMERGQEKERKGMEKAIGSIYQPQYTSNIDQLLYEMLQKQAGYQMPGEYQDIVGQLMKQFQGMGQGSQYQDYLNQLLTESFKPQGDIYDYYSGKLRQDIGSQVSAAGLGTSPVGVGLVGEGLTDLSKQYALNEDIRRRNALQSFLSGQQGVAGIGRGALTSALDLERGKQYPVSQSVAGLQSYLGGGMQAGQAVAPYYAQQGQLQAQPYYQTAQSLGGLVGGLGTIAGRMAGGVGRGDTSNALLLRLLQGGGAR